jgi:hypothetical protein
MLKFSFNLVLCVQMTSFAWPKHSQDDADTSGKCHRSKQGHAHMFIDSRKLRPDDTLGCATAKRG